MFKEKKEKVGGQGKPRAAEVVVRGRVVGNEVRGVGRGQNLYCGSTR